MVTALRALLRFLHVTGRVPASLCGAPGARKRARRVRQAAWGNGPVDDTGTAPQVDFTRPEPHPHIPPPRRIRSTSPAPTGPGSATPRSPDYPPPTGTS